MPARRREVLRPSSPTAPMAAARTTLGSGRTRTTKARSNTAASGGRQGRRRPSQPGEAERRGQHDGDVAAAHRREVGHAGDEHRLLEIVRCAGGVADDQPRQQPPRVGRKPVGGLGEARPHDLRCPGHPARLAGTVGGPRGVRTATTSSARVLRRRQPTGGHHARLPRELEPGPVGEDQDRRGDRRPDASAVDLVDIDPQDDAGRALRPAPPVGRRPSGRTPPPRRRTPRLADRRGRGSGRRPGCSSRRPRRRAPATRPGPPGSTSPARRRRATGATGAAGGRRVAGGAASGDGGAAAMTAAGPVRRRVRRQATARPPDVTSEPSEDAPSSDAGAPRRRATAAQAASAGTSSRRSAARASC